MVTALESKAALELVTEEAVATATAFLMSTSGSWESRRADVLEVVPDVIGAYGLGAAALAADFYDDSRVAVGLSGYVAVPIVLDRTVKVRRGLAWASQPLQVDDWDLALKRLTEIVQPEVARSYRDTVVGNSREDKKCVGWRRITTGGCGFCLMLAANGAVYKSDTVDFAAHPHCGCTAAPVFVGGEVGPEASVIQYMASGRRRSEREKADVRKWVAFYEGR